jgi:hypothetical protein
LRGPTATIHTIFVNLVDPVQEAVPLAHCPDAALPRQTPRRLLANLHRFYRKRIPAVTEQPPAIGHRLNHGKVGG